MYRQFFLAGLAAAVLFSGCKLQKDEPVAQEKSIGRILDTAFQGKVAAREFEYYTSRISKLVEGALIRGVREDQLSELAEMVVKSGSKGINNFKQDVIRKIFYDFVETSKEMGQRLSNKIEALPPSVKIEFEAKMGTADADYAVAAAFLRKHTDIADDKIFARLVEQQGKNLDDFAEAVVTNHRLADAVGAELANKGRYYGLEGLNISAEQISSELKISSKDFYLEKILFTTSTKKTTDGYKFLQELSGVDVYDEAHVLDLLLRRGKDGKPVYQTLSAEEIKKLGNPFDKKFTKPIINGKYSERWSSEHLREFYGN